MPTQPPPWEIAMRLDFGGYMAHLGITTWGGSKMGKVIIEIDVPEGFEMNRDYVRITHPLLSRLLLAVIRELQREQLCEPDYQAEGLTSGSSAPQHLPGVQRNQYPPC